jgi:O-antigen/teichoic acid export membrane protein
MVTGLNMINRFNLIQMYNRQSIVRKSFLWNMIGSVIYAMVTLLMLISATRALGQNEAGVFAIAFTTGQLMLTIGYYDMRTYQVSDVSNVFSFRQYFSVRLFTCSVMIIASFIFIFAEGYSLQKSIVVLLMCLYKMIDGLADVYEGYFQQQGRLDIAGISLSFRTVISVTAFIVSVFLTKNLIYAVIISVIAAFIGFIIFDVIIADARFGFKVSFDFSQLKKILIDCFPLFAGSFMSLYISMATKYSIDKHMAERYQTIYNIIYIPTSVINLFCVFILKPLITTLAFSWNQSDKKRFVSIIFKLFLFLIGLTLITLVGTYFLGIPVLSWLSGVDLSAYRIDLLILILGGGFSAIDSIWYYALTVMRRQNRMLIGYSVTFVAALLITPPLVKYSGLDGGSIAYSLLMLILAAVLLVILFICYKQTTKRSLSPESPDK